MRKIIFIIMINFSLWVPISCLADHALLDALAVQPAPEEIAILFNGSAAERVALAYAIYERGDMAADPLLAYWNRVYRTAEGDELGDMLAEIHDIGDPDICTLTDEADMPEKPSDVTDLCK